MLAVNDPTTVPVGGIDLLVNFIIADSGFLDGTVGFGDFTAVLPTGLGPATLFTLSNSRRSVLWHSIPVANFELVLEGPALYRRITTSGPVSIQQSTSQLLFQHAAFPIWTLATRTKYGW